VLIEESAVRPQVSQGATAGTPGTLYRHPTHKVLGGVCGGLADFLGWDATLIRIFWVVLTLATGGGGLLAYLALWILLPVGTVGGGQDRPATIELNERTLVRAAYILIGLGALWLLGNVGVLPWLWSGLWQLLSVVFWPALLIGAGVLLLRGLQGKNWREDLGGLSQRFKSRVNGHVPSGDDVKASLKEARQRFPLKRSRTDRIFMGVCGGLARKLGIDANLVRLVWAAFSVGSIGMGVFLYVLLGLLLPEDVPADLSDYRRDAQEVHIVDGTVSESV
jgi:phage shock protein PspC (stress-responsive transcriptional regulator)